MVAGAQPLVVVVDRHRQHHLGAILADHILIQPLTHAARRRQTGRAGRPGALRDYRWRLGLLGDNRTTQRYTFVAYKDGAGASDEALNLILTPATKRTEIGPAASAV